jgi:hypothetical protein
MIETETLLENCPCCGAWPIGRQPAKTGSAPLRADARGDVRFLIGRGQRACRSGGGSEGGCCYQPSSVSR